ncbi:MAG: hypothetical protein RLZZ308_284 [Candidatus Parcubacteria bacterium]|jgi:hypothetical protein
MRYFLRTIIIVSTISVATLQVSAASLRLVFSQGIPKDGQPFVVDVFIAPEGVPLSGVAGDFSFQSDMFDVYTITTSGSVVTPWVVYPHVSDERYLDNRTHVTFEGIFAGGFSGVRSAYYDGVKDGKAFSLILIPKKRGESLLTIDTITLNTFNERATSIPTTQVVERVDVKSLPIRPTLTSLPEKQVSSSNLLISLSRSDLVYRNAWYLSVTEKESYSPIEQIFVAESDAVSAQAVASYEWRAVSSPYMLIHQDRSKYLHIKIVYANNSYAIETIQPVENSHRISLLSRILIHITILIICVVAYLYAKRNHFFLSQTT